MHLLQTLLILVQHINLDTSAELSDLHIPKYSDKTRHVVLHWILLLDHHAGGLIQPDLLTHLTLNRPTDDTVPSARYLRRIRRKSTQQHQNPELAWWCLPGQLCRWLDDQL